MQHLPMPFYRYRRHRLAVPAVPSLAGESPLEANNIPIAKDAMLVTLSCGYGTTFGISHHPQPPHCGGEGLCIGFRAGCVSLCWAMMYGCGQSPATGLSCRREFSGFPPRIPAPYTPVFLCQPLCVLLQRRHDPGFTPSATRACSI
jgi:hypothetical protein